MPGLVNELVAVLKEQAENYEDLLALSTEKRDVIINNDIESLQKITSLENTYVGRVGRLEKRRGVLISDIATVLNCEARTLTISQLAHAVRSQPEGRELLEVGDRIRAAVDNLKIANDRNKMLIDHSLEYIEYTLNMISGSVDNGPRFYDIKGKEIGGDLPFFDARQ